ncbi:MAG: hypothetical protein EP309_08845 [Gammaproteobacteria bacterium]|jgi:hypothetical protein|nr:hypothetical protein [Candidatus Thioaporhodococcus sediminis]TNF52638.1 MAG: hypothetical protein EP309_08845 [Gammaproteobacteria bacterium]
MASFASLHQEIHDITEKNNVFRYLIQDRFMCDTKIVENLFFDYVKLVKKHMEQVDREFCRQLLSHEAQTVRNTANRFLSGSSEIKRIFADYLKHYCSPPHQCLRIKDHARFLEDTNQMFDLVLDRIERETEHLYPLIRSLEIQTEEKKAA